MLKQRILATLLITLFSANSVSSHKDTYLEIQKDGTLLGLPKEYQPAYFDRQNFILSIGSKKLKLPHRVRKYFEEDKIHELYISASWYGWGGGAKTPYILFRIVRLKGKKSYGLLFNMKTLMPISFQVGIEKTNTPSFGYDSTIEIDEQFRKEFEQNIKTQ